MNTVLLAIIAFGSIFSIVSHIVETFAVANANKKRKEALRKMREEWEDQI